MGIIYKITSLLDNKCFIGKNDEIKDVEALWKQHVYESQRVHKGHCKNLNMTIRKQGRKNFKLEILEECDNEILNEKEMEYIEKFNCFIPYGMNINENIDIEKNIQKNQEIKKNVEDILLNNLELPMYVEKENEGYKVVGHPMGPEKKWVSKRLSNEYCLTKALKYLYRLDNLKEPFRPIEPVEKLPEFINKHRNGYVVKYPNTKQKFFVSRFISNEVLLVSALEYVENLKVQFND